MKSELIRVDQQDLKILNLLRKNARQTLTNMSRDAGIPISTIFDKLKRLEHIGVIKAHTSMLDMNKIGYRLHAFVFLKDDNNQKERLIKTLIENPKVNNITRVNENWNFLIEVFFREIIELEEFIETLENDFKSIEISVHYALEDIKREGFLIGDELKNQLR